MVLVVMCLAGCAIFLTPRFLLLQLNQYDRLTQRSRPKPSASGPLVPAEGQ